MANLIIVEVVYPRGHSANRFRVIEKVVTIDGPRDRCTYESFATLAEAEEYVKAHNG